jgi:hypothetical protein
MAVPTDKVMVTGYTDTMALISSSGRLGEYCRCIQMVCGNMMIRGLVMVMYTPFVRRRSFNRWGSTIGLFLVLAIPVKGQHGDRVIERQLYLIAATPTGDIPETYPASLYRVGDGDKLQLVRQIVPPTDGVLVVRASMDSIYFVHPVPAATTVSIVHTDSPMRKDEIVLGQRPVFPYTPQVTIAIGPSGSEELLIPWLFNSADPIHSSGTVESISSSSSTNGSRMTANAWDEFVNLRYEGGIGGPEVLGPFDALEQDGNLIVDSFHHRTTIDSLPEALRGSNSKLLLFVYAASHEYLVLGYHSASSVDPSQLPSTESLYVHDRIGGAWHVAEVEGNWSQLRLFGPWLGAIVRMARDVHAPEVTPQGRDSERAFATTTLPNVQKLFARWAGRYYWSPGILTLENLVDGRKVRIETNEEDSEILSVTGDTVVYRVNDTIYQGRISGGEMLAPTVVVKGEDVPEIHWVFWSK